MKIQLVRNAAERLVAEMGITKPPVNPTRIAERLGLHVANADLGPEVSGVLITNAPDDVYILVRASDADVRRRFSIAHEIGHHQLQHQVGREHVHVDSPQRMMFRGPRAAQGVDRVEIEANNFAASLLMPSEMLTREISDRHPLLDDDIDALARKFKVSPQSMTIRLTSLGLALYESE